MHELLLRRALDLNEINRGIGRCGSRHARVQHTTSVFPGNSALPATEDSPGDRRVGALELRRSWIGLMLRLPIGYGSGVSASRPNECRRRDTHWNV